ncbi:MAG: NTP pyrophosphatase (non-canonical NTP hydrolase) [Candidatus Latescibacterota bacterium]|jgi:NTP pyrophosphatase (non-canonical NTP hydrolase)
MPDLSANPTLKDFQKYAQELENERGFSDQDVLQKCLMLGEEVGELFKVVRKRTNIKIDPNSKVGEAGEELTDVFIFLLAIANRLDVDLEQAFRDKEEKNKTRVWK